MDFQKLKEKLRSFMKGSGSNSPDPGKGVIVPSKTERMFDGFTKVDIYAAVAGTVVAQKDIPDKAFAEGHMGQGVGIIPIVGHFHAYFDGTLTFISKIKNSYVMQPKDTELSVLMQIGIDVDKIPEIEHYFGCDLKEGVFLERNDHLCTANIWFIKEQGKSDMTLLFVKDENMEFKKVIYHKKPGEYVHFDELLMSIVRDDK